LNRGSAGKHPQPDECFIGVVSTPIIQHSEGKKSQGFGDRVPYSTKRQKKSHSRRMALKSWFEDWRQITAFYIVHDKNMSDIAKIKR